MYLLCTSSDVSYNEDLWPHSLHKTIEEAVACVNKTILDRNNGDNPLRGIEDFHLKDISEDFDTPTDCTRYWVHYQGFFIFEMNIRK